MSMSEAKRAIYQRLADKEITPEQADLELRPETSGSVRLVVTEKRCLGFRGPGFMRRGLTAYVPSFEWILDNAEIVREFIEEHSTGKLEDVLARRESDPMYIEPDDDGFVRG